MFSYVNMVALYVLRFYTSQIERHPSTIITDSNKGMYTTLQKSRDRCDVVDEVFISLYTLVYKFIYL